MTTRGKFIRANHGKSFSQSLINNQLTLPADSYCVMIDPNWNETAESDQEYKKVILDLYGPESVVIS